MKIMKVFASNSKIVLFLICFLLFSNSNASSWELSGNSSNGQVEYYVDFENARLVNKEIEYWSLFNFKNPENYDAKSYSSRVQKSILNCARVESITTHIILYSEKYAKGLIVASVPPPSNNPWVPIPPNSLSNSSSKKLCKKFNMGY